MSLKLSPEILAAAYDYLALTEPFKNWNLLPSDEVTFKVSRSKDFLARYTYWLESEKQQIEVSEYHVKRTDTLISSMAHEICHMHERLSGMCSPKQEHSKVFEKLAARVCKVHGWDPALF